MDPNACLKEILERVGEVVHDGDIDSGERLAHLVQDLHEWLSKGGFLPAAWERGGKNEHGR
jgi:hypothetical protein